MATITTDTYLDDGTARTAGETWTINNGAKLTIRTDTRWHIGSPVSMTGSIGSVTMAAFSSVYVDGTFVRWQPFTLGAGLVPAIGSTVTQASNPGVSAYLLGVWVDLASAPSTPGSAMPTTGFLKYREVSGGSMLPSDAITFSGGAATCTSSGDEVAGWIEVATDAASTLTFTQPDSTFKVRGEWFYLGTTSGSPGQIVQLPTNGSSSTYGLGIQVETAPGSDTYEWWPGNSTNMGWATNGLTTDVRGKFVQSLTNGQVRIGSNGTSDIGYTPVAGCKMRTPNVFIQHCLTTARNQNVINTSLTLRGWRWTSNVLIDCDKFVTTQQMSTSGTNSIDMSNCLIDGYLNIQTNLSPVTLSDIAITSCTGTTNYGNGFALTDCANVTVTRLKNCYSTTSPLSLVRVTDSTFNDCIIGRLYARTATPPLGYIAYTKNVTFNDLKIFGIYLSIDYCNYTAFYNTDYIERLDGITSATNATPNVFLVNYSNNVTVDGFTIGLNEAILDVHPYASSGVISLNYCGSGNKFRNFGSFSAPLKTGANETTRTSRIITLNGMDGITPTKFQRMYFDRLKVANPFGVANYTSKNFEISEVGTLYSGAQVQTLGGYDGYYRALYGNIINFNGGFPAVGVMFVDQFTDATTGSIGFFFSSPTTLTSAYYDYSFSTGSGFSTLINVLLRTAGDYATLETPYWVKGHTGFSNIAPVIQGTTTSCTFSYALDAGSGYSSFKTLNATNLSAEVVDAAVGFKMKLKVTCTANNTTAEIKGVRIYTTTSTTAHGGNLYPLDTVTLGFENLQPGSEVRAYVGTDPATAVEIGGIESVTGTTWSFTHDSAGQEGYIAVFALGYNPLIIPRTYASEDSTILISQVIDRTYENVA